MKMNSDILEVLDRNVIYLATASLDGIPNVVPIGGKKIIDEESLLIVDVLLNRTKTNILDNPKVAIIVEDLKRQKPVSFQLKGTAAIYSEGEYLRQAENVSETAWQKRKKSGHRTRYKVRSAVIVNVEEIFSNMHGGKKISGKATVD